MSLTDRLSSTLDRHLSRRNFVVRSAFAASAVAAVGMDFVLRPGTAYGAMCDTRYCGNQGCSCGSTCCNGFTEFCCVINGGYNSCPAGTIVGGWWVAEGSRYCQGPRYYMDCNGACSSTDGCGDGSGFCERGSDGLSCGCANYSCENYMAGCLQFRYGQCNQDVACLGRIKCRVVTCVPPWEIDATCTTASAADDLTANQNATCLTSGPTYPPEEITMFLAYATSDSSDGTIKTDYEYLIRESGIVPLETRTDVERLTARLGPLVGLSGDQISKLAAF